MDQEQQNGARSRYRNRTKRKKTNIILNSLIVIVILLILGVGFSIFSGNDDAAPKPEDKVASDSKTGSNSNGENSNTSGETATNDNSSASDDDTAADEETAEPTVTEGGSSPNVKRTIENPAWKPAGTTQTGPHNVVVDSSSPDWDDMLNALAYAIETDKANMTTWWLERDKSNEGGAIGTVSAKGEDQTYRVYLQWVDGQGYKPVKVEELIENDKK